MKKRPLLFRCDCMNEQTFQFDTNRQICLSCGKTYENSDFLIPEVILDGIEIEMENQMK